MKKRKEERVNAKLQKESRIRRWEEIGDHFVDVKLTKKHKSGLESYLSEGNGSLKEALASVYQKLKAKKDYAIHCWCDLCNELNI